MSQEFVNIKIAPDGTINVDMEGYVGNSCDAVLATLNRVLGESPIKEVKKPSYYSEVNQEQQRE